MSIRSQQPIVVPNRAALSDSKQKLLERYSAGRAPDVRLPGREINPRPVGTMPLLSLTQEQVWKRANSLKELPGFYHECITIHRTGDLRVDILEDTLAEIVARHSIWRTNFRQSSDGPVQVIHPAPSKFALHAIRLTHVAPEKRRSEALRLAAEHARPSFDLEQDALVRVLLVSLDEQNHQLFLALHQAVVDGISVYRILLHELSSLYEAFCAGDPSPLPKLKIQFADFAEWERQWLSGPVGATQVAYWKDQLSSFPILRWPAQELGLARPGSRGAIQPFSISQILQQNLNELAQQAGVTLFMTLLAGLAILLSTKSQQKTITIGTMAPAGRKHLDVQPLLGYFLNPVALRLDLSGDSSVQDLLHQCRDATLGALTHDDVPFEVMMEEIHPELDTGSQSLLPVALTLAPPLNWLESGWHQTPMDIDTGWAKWALYLELSERPEGLLGRAQYSTDFFSSAIVSQLVEEYAALLGALTADPWTPISKLIESFAQKG